MTGEVLSATNTLIRSRSNLDKINVSNQTKIACIKTIESVRDYLRLLSLEEKKESETTVKLLKKELESYSTEIQVTHEMLDKLDAPRQKFAIAAQRMLWYNEGKRESRKTKENPQGYLPDLMSQIFEKEDNDQL